MSKKPHFFNPLLPGFENGITIRPNFLKFLVGTWSKKAVLKRGGREWHVKYNLGKFEDDVWKNFLEDNDFHIGDFIVFRPEGNMVFEVMKFDPSTCEKECPIIPVIKEPSTCEKECPIIPVIKEPTEIIEEYEVKLEPKELKRAVKATPVAETIFSRERPHFISFIRPYSVKYSKLYLPEDFAKENEMRKFYKINLVDDLQRTWPVVLRHNKRYVSLGSGWVNFRNANGFKEGDRFKFEMVKIGTTPVVKFTKGILPPLPLS